QLPVGCGSGADVEHARAGRHACRLRRYPSIAVSEIEGEEIAGCRPFLYAGQHFSIEPVAWVLSTHAVIQSAPIILSCHLDKWHTGSKVGCRNPAESQTWGMSRLPG